MLIYTICQPIAKIKKIAYLYIVSKLIAGDSDGAATALRAHISVQGEKFALLVTDMKMRTLICQRTFRTEIWI